MDEGEALFYVALDEASWWEVLGIVRARVARPKRIKPTKFTPSALEAVAKIRERSFVANGKSAGRVPTGYDVQYTTKLWAEKMLENQPVLFHYGDPAEDPKMPHNKAIQMYTAEERGEARGCPACLKGGSGHSEWCELYGSQQER